MSAVGLQTWGNEEYFIAHNIFYDIHSKGTKKLIRNPQVWDMFKTDKTRVQIKGP